MAPPDNYDDFDMSSPRDSSMVVLLDENAHRSPMKPRHDEPQVNVPSTTPKSKKRHKKKEISYNEMDEASREAHIVQKIERAIKKSKSERREHASRRKSRERGDRHTHSSSHNGSATDENYQMNKNHEKFRNKSPRRSTSGKKPRHRHRPKPQLEPPRTKGNKYRSVPKGPLDLDERMDHLDQLDGIVDDKRGLQVHVDDHWLTETFSDPTLDTYENNHFRGNHDKSKSKVRLSNMLDPQRIQCGAGRLMTETIAGSSKSGPDPVTGIIDRKHERNGGKNSKSYTAKAHEQIMTNDPQRVHGHSSRKAKSHADHSPAELISFDNYEDNDGYFYEDDEDESPIYPSSASPPPPPPRTSKADKNSLSHMHFQSVGDYKGLGDLHNPIQDQLDEINELHKEIEKQQELIMRLNQPSKMDSNHQRNMPTPHETSAEIYQRELARQAQAELYRLELVQKSKLLEKQMEIFRRNQEEWNKVRDLAIKEEEERRKVVEKAKKAWQDEMQNAGHRDPDIRADRLAQGSQVIVDNKPSDEVATSFGGSSHRDAVSTADTSSVSKAPSLYGKVAELNKQASVTDEDQKIIELEILKELHMELSRQAADKKVHQKARFLAEKMRTGWSGMQAKWSNDPNKGVEEATEELSRQIRELNLEMASSKNATKGRKDGPKRRMKKLFKVPKARSKNNDHGDNEGSKQGSSCCEDEEEERDDQSVHSESGNEAGEQREDGHQDDNRISNHREENHDRRSTTPKKRRALLNALGFKKTDKEKTPPRLEPSNESQARLAEAEKTKKKNRMKRAFNRIEQKNPPIEEGEESSTPSATSTSASLEEIGDIVLGQTRNSVRRNSSASLDPGSLRLRNAMMSPSSSKSTQVTSNRVYIGVHGDCIEAISFSPRGKALSISSSAECTDRYEPCTTADDPVQLHSATVTAGSRSMKTPTNANKREDEPSLFEYLEVQCHEDGSEEEAPMDELQADWRGI
jgi:hypothetical protein